MAQSEITRRDLLKRGAVLGGAVMWATPVVQVVGMRPALAQEASPGCNVWYAVKVEREGDSTVPVCEDITGGANPPGQCLDVGAALPSGVTPSGGGCDHFSAILAAEDAANKSWTITFDEDCQFVPDAGRCTVGQASQCFDTNTCQYDAATRTLTFSTQTGQDISHVEFVFCCSS
jgi:hypothetical protein